MPIFGGRDGLGIDHSRCKSASSSPPPSLTGSKLNCESRVPISISGKSRASPPPLDVPGRPRRVPARTPFTKWSTRSPKYRSRGPFRRERTWFQPTKTPESLDLVSTLPIVVETWCLWAQPLRSSAYHSVCVPWTTDAGVHLCPALPKNKFWTANLNMLIIYLLL